MGGCTVVLRFGIANVHERLIPIVDIALFQANTDGNDRVARKAIPLGRVDHCTPLMDDKALAWSSEYIRSQSRQEDGVKQHNADCQRSVYSKRRMTIRERVTVNQNQMNVMGSMKDDTKKAEEQRYHQVIYNIVRVTPRV